MIDVSLVNFERNSRIGFVSRVCHSKVACNLVFTLEDGFDNSVYD